MVEVTHSYDVAIIHKVSIVVRHGRAADGRRKYKSKS